LNDPNPERAGDGKSHETCDIKLNASEHK